MNKVINGLTIAAVSCVALVSTVEAASVCVSRARTTAFVERPAVIAERTVVVEQPTYVGTVVSGSTLAGRRDIRSRCARITLDGNGRATIVDDRGTRNVRIRGFLNSDDVDFDTSCAAPAIAERVVTTTSSCPPVTTCPLD